MRGALRCLFGPCELGKSCAEWKREGPALKKRIDFSLDRSLVVEVVDDGVEVQEESLETRVVSEELSMVFRVVVDTVVQVGCLFP